MFQGIRSLTAAIVALADIQCAGDNILRKIMLATEHFVLLRILIGDTVAECYARCPDQFRAHEFCNSSGQNGTDVHQRHFLLRNIHPLRQLRSAFGTKGFHQLGKCLAIHYGIDFSPLVSLAHRPGRQVIVHDDDIFDLAVLEIQLLVIIQLCRSQFVHQTLHLSAARVQMIQQFLQPQYPQPQVLRGDQCILVEQGNLDTTPADVQDRRLFFNDSAESLSLGSNGLVIQETLFGVA